MYTNVSEIGTPDNCRTTHHYLFVQLYGWHHWPSLSRRWLVVGHQTDADQRRCRVYLRGRKIAVIEPFISALFCCAAGELTIYRRLSAFLIDMAALRLGQHADPEKVQLCNGFCQHQLRRGEAVAIVLKRHGLSAACDDRNTDVIISLATLL